MRPANDRVDIWLVPLERALPELGDRLALLTYAERARAGRFARARDAAEFVMVRSTLRGLLGRALGVPAARVHIHEEPGRKPVLAHDGPTFSVSHTCGLGVVALSHDRALGVDVEYAGPVTPSSDMPGFSAAESSAVLAAADPAAAFYRCWTLKEALLKASGAGTGGEMPEIALDDVDHRMGAFVARSVDVGAPYHAALAVESRDGAPFPAVVIR